MLNNLRRTLSDLDSDDVLEKLGLESRRSSAERVVPALAVFGAGVLVGVAIGLILAPKSGNELRGQLQSQLDKARVKVGLKDGEEVGSEKERSQTSAPVPVRPA